MSATIKEDRRSWLEKLITKRKADEVRGELQAASAVMDNAGIKRKEAPVTETQEEPAPPPPEQQPETPDQEMLYKMAAKMADDLLVSLKDKLQNVTKEELAAALMSSMGMPPEQTSEEEETYHPVTRLFV